MKVKDLIAHLSTLNPDAQVGVSFTSRNGYVQKVTGVCEVLSGQLDEDTVTIDMAEETLGEDEVYFVEPPH